MPFPSDSGTISTSMQGGTLVADAVDDHALHHRSIGTVINNLSTTFGTTAGTNLLRQAVNAGDQLFSLNLGGTAYQTISKGTANNMVCGTPAITGGTYNALNLGTAPQAKLGGDTTGDIYYNNGGTISRLGIGTNTQVLTTNGTTPSWGTVKSVQFITSGSITDGTTASSSPVDVATGSVTIVNTSTVTAQAIVTGRMVNNGTTNAMTPVLVVNGTIMQKYDIQVDTNHIVGGIPYALNCQAVLNPGTSAIKLQVSTANGTAQWLSSILSVVYG